jgi:hypothetical protein
MMYAAGMVFSIDFSAINGDAVTLSLNQLNKCQPASLALSWLLDLRSNQGPTA